MSTAKGSAAGGLSYRKYAEHRGCSEGAVRKAVNTGRISVLAKGVIDPAIADVEWAKNTVQTAPAAQVRTAPGGTQRGTHAASGTQAARAGTVPASNENWEVHPGALPAAEIDQLLSAAAKRANAGATGQAVSVALEPQPRGGALKRSRAIADDDLEFDPEAEYNPLATPLNDGRRIKEASLAGLRLLDFRKAKGQLWERELIKRLIFTDRRVARDALRHLARRVAPDLAEMGGDVQAIRERLETEIETALNKLADDLPALLRATARATDATPDVQPTEAVA